MLVSDINTATPPFSVVRIEVERLFGRYTYTLINQNQNSHSNSSLIILYGDNGSGKTTILKLLFHLLSSGQNRGHRTFLARTPFSRFSVLLADGTYIVVTREDDNLVGSYKLKILRKEDSFEENIQVDSDNRVTYRQGDKFYEIFSELQLNLFFLGDNRVLESDIFETKEIDRIQRIDKLKIERSVLAEIRRSLDGQPGIDQDSVLKTSIQQTEEWVREQALIGSNAGAANVHSIYEDIIARIITSGESGENELQHSPDNLIKLLKEQQIRSNDFSRFGLMSPISTQKLVHLIQSAPESTDSIILEVLNPYLDSVKARMDALQNTQDLLTLFVNTINKQFFRDKEIRLHVQKGVSIVTEEGIELKPDMLSSGEKQLLLLFCNTLTARDKATIFIIDEPELSLNIKWQRQLIRSLLDLTKGSQVQFLLATHSFELLSQYRRNVVKLENQGH